MSYMTYILIPSDGMETISTEDRIKLQNEYATLLAKANHNLTYLLDMVTLDLEDYLLNEEDKFMKTFNSHHYAIGGKCFPIHTHIKDFEMITLEFKVEEDRSRHLVKELASSYHYTNIFFQLLDVEDDFYAHTYSDMIPLKPKMETSARITKHTMDRTNMNRVFEDKKCNISSNYRRYRCKK